MTQSRFLHLSFPFLALNGLAVPMLLASLSAVLAQSPQGWDKRQEYKDRGFVELTGADAASFLVGNSVIVPEEKEGTLVVQRNEIFYFLDLQTMYRCSKSAEGDCEVGSWSISENGLCSGVDICAKPFSVFRSPKWQEWDRHAGDLGVYLAYGHFAYQIVKGNWTNGPLFDTKVGGRAIELDRASLADEANEAARLNLPDGQIRIQGARALSLLIGNTFLSKDAEAGLKDKPDIFCPQYGLYYSAEGFVLSFSCNAERHDWWFDITRWKLVSGLLCLDDVENIEEFQCKGAVVTAVPSDASARMHVMNFEGSGKFQDNLMAYAGNIFNFRLSSSQQR